MLQVLLPTLISRARGVTTLARQRRHQQRVNQSNKKSHRTVQCFCWGWEAGHIKCNCPKKAEAPGCSSLPILEQWMPQFTHMRSIFTRSNPTWSTLTRSTYYEIKTTVMRSSLIKGTLTKSTYKSDEKVLH